MVNTGLYWLPEPGEDWRSKAMELSDGGAGAWAAARPLALANLNFIRTNMLDSALQKALGGSTPQRASGKPVRLAILGSSTTSHLHAGIRLGGLRRDIPITTYEPDYGQYWQELINPESALHQFAPTAVLFALDSRHLTAGIGAGSDAAAAEAAHALMLGRLRQGWRLAREAFSCPVIQQTAIAVFPPLMGSAEHRLAGSPARFLVNLNEAVRSEAAREGVDLLSLDTQASKDGLAAWHNTGLWHRAKQEISPSAGPLYGDLLARVLAAQQGRSAKALVLDLDNTLWGGVVGDDGVDGLVLGQGSALGEAFAAFQAYARDLARRGVILAVCSKNEESNALEVFERHPEMVLRRADIAAFTANWRDKAANIRAIAAELNIGLDSLVFVDDNPSERMLVRQELPMVSVPEVGDDPTLFPQILADAGYFEALLVTDDDRARATQYQENAQRSLLEAQATDLPSFLKSLDMRLRWSRFDQTNLSRVVQLINKTNQFNLTTRRYSEAEVRAMMNDPAVVGVQFRLLDRFGDNGLIGVVIAHLRNEDDLEIDTWLMSCRVLGRQVEAATLNVIAELAARLGARRIIGEYRPSPKNGMVKDHYSGLGFETLRVEEGGVTKSALDLKDFEPPSTFIDIKEA